MLEGIGLAQILDYGVSGAVVLAVLLGWLIPRWVHVQRTSDKDAQIAYLQAALDRRDEQVDKLIEGQSHTVHLLEDIKATAARARGAGR